MNLRDCDEGLSVLLTIQHSMTTSMSTSELVAMLRRSADIVERGEFNPLLYQTMKALTKYAGDYAEGGISASSGSAQKQRRGHNNISREIEKDGKKGAFHDVPDNVLGGGKAGRSRSSERDGEHSQSSVKHGDKGHKGTGVFSLKGIKKGIEKIGNDILGDHRDEQAPFDEKDKAFESSNDEYHDQAPTSASTEQQEKPTKPCFQRPINPSSNLIANGWIDQQRRSKMRVVWKDVLASLVEGRRPGEETTLWIQRQVVSPQTGKVTGLEALHQIPMKWLEDVNYVDLYNDHRFTLKVFNIAEEFYFRTRDEQSAQNWVLTLRSARDASLDSIDRMKQNVPVSESSGARLSVEEVGLNGLNDSDPGRLGLQPSDKTQVGTIPEAQAGSEDSDRPSSSSTPRAQQQHPQPTSIRLPISELRSIAHGAGYNTRGMERQDLERIAAHVLGGSPTPQTQSSSAPIQSSSNQMRDIARREAELAAAKERQEQELAESRRRQKAKENEERIAENMRKEREESERQRVEDQRTAEMKRRQELEEQASEIKRQQEVERQRRMAELQAAERARQQQVYQQQQQAAQQAQYHQQQQQQQAYQRAQYQQQQSYQQAQYQQQQQANFGQFFNQQMPQQNPGGYSQQQQPSFHQQQAQGQPPQQNGAAHIPAKYEEKSDEEQSAATTQIKRNILINWALLPPNLNVLRPIDQLVTTIHTAMPPAFGVPGHTYFTKFSPIAQGELVVSSAMGNRPDETKLKKAVRKVRVFLHPDKLPRDLTSEQSFTARMLWDITSDSWEEFQKHKEDLDWIHG